MAIREPWPDAYVQGTTSGLPEGRDYEAFCESIADVYVGVRPSRPTRARFDADFALFDLGPLSMGYISTPGVSGHRDRSSLARIADDALFLNYGLGPWGLQQRGRDWRLRSKRTLLLDNAEPFTVVADPHSRLRLFSLRIPRALLSEHVRSHLSGVDDALAHAPIGAHVAAQMALVDEMLRIGKLSLATAMASAVVGLVNAAAETPDGSSIDRVAQCKAIARTRLGDSTLDLAAIARSVGCSTRTVQTAFAARGETFSGWLRDERLDLAWEMLVAASGTRTVSAIADECGFADVGTFHRGFRQRFGTTPAAAR
ncbi:hypothetical protein ASD65_08075 [Microbacterium sp. Root61]|uniref:helix-turn-helix transcriptional regulator n=1 Tax=Microbacterium sp. Root61 TaxID=1736570 RepID=UPI000700E001|nr:AraC family transcriptional regulator [Microbacterium sp. Root61]KRA24386.1 hypothetical protein ASD65_08075 [Microbacterium sp. Root61]